VTKPFKGIIELDDRDSTPDWEPFLQPVAPLASTKRNWPISRGFERYYGFLGGETNQWYPDLVYDNHPVGQPYSPEDGYHLTVDPVDKAIEFITDSKVITPDKPFFMYFCPGATHAPHHAPKEWIPVRRGPLGALRHHEGPDRGVTTWLRSTRRS
jgi:arylsulfatase A-like enzyme